MARTSSRYRSRSRSRSRIGSGRIPARVVAAAAGSLLVVLNGLFVLGPVLGLVGAAAAAGPVLDVPTASITVLVVLGFLVAVACVAGAYLARRSPVAWTLAVIAWAVSLGASVWPIIATANAAVERVRDIVPYIADLVRSVT